VSGVGSYRYDANGNRTSDPTDSYTYDIENHLTQVSQGGTTIFQNTVDGDGVRLVRVANGKTTHYVGDWYEYDLNAGVPAVYYPFNSRQVARTREAAGKHEGVYLNTVV